jgi:hypothetical protein
MPFVLAVFAVFSATAQQQSATYRDLVERVQSGDFSIDFRALRMACMQASDCAPRGSKADLGAMIQAEKDGQYERAAEVAEKLIAEGFVNVEAHASASADYAKLGDVSRAKFHLDVVSGLVRSILDSGDGLTRTTAFEIVCDREIYVTLTAVGMPYLGPGVTYSNILDYGGHKYQRVTSRDPKSGKEVDLYFNIDAYSLPKSRVSDR